MESPSVSSVNAEDYSNLKIISKVFLITDCWFEPSPDYELIHTHMNTLSQLEKAMRAQFVWEKNPTKPLQTLEAQEGAKDIARMIFVGIADMHGFKSEDIQNYLDMRFDSYRHKLSTFRENMKECRARENEDTIYSIDDSIKKFYMKVNLTLNAIKYMYGGSYFTFSNIKYE